MALLVIWQSRYDDVWARDSGADESIRSADPTGVRSPQGDDVALVVIWQSRSSSGIIDLSTIKARLLASTIYRQRQPSFAHGAGFHISACGSRGEGPSGRGHQTRCLLPLGSQARRKCLSLSLISLKDVGLILHISFLDPCRDADASGHRSSTMIQLPYRSYLYVMLYSICMTRYSTQRVALSLDLVVYTKVKTSGRCPCSVSAFSESHIQARSLRASTLCWDTYGSNDRWC